MGADTSACFSFRKDASASGVQVMSSFFLFALIRSFSGDTNVEKWQINFLYRDVIPTNFLTSVVVVSLGY